MVMTPTAAGGYCYSAAAATSSLNIQAAAAAAAHMEGYEHNTTAEEIYHNNVELIGFHHQKSNHHHHLQQQQQQQQGSETTSSSLVWKGFFKQQHGGGPSPSSSKAAANNINNINEPSSSEFYNHHHQDFSNKPMSDTTSESCLMVAPPPDHHHHQSTAAAAWHVNDGGDDDDPSALRCVSFPCEGNERPSQGLSLSLSASNPSSLGLQSFELMRQPHHPNDNHDMRFLASSSSSSRDNNGFFIRQQMMQDNNGYFLGNNKAAAATIHYHQAAAGQQQFHIRNSKYLVPAQELLNEFCNLGTKHTDLSSRIKLQKTSINQWQDENAAANDGSSSKKQSLFSLDLLELQKRKSKLLQMLEEVDRRYRHYCDQMKSVVSPFEAVAGSGAATVYSVLASRAMSRHFRCLRDGIVDEIKATKKAMGDKDNTSVAPGTTRGETPRLRILDQTLRQQRAFQQMNLMESHPWRPQRGLPERSVSVLRAWLFEHFLHPYPSDVDKHILARQTGLSRSQVSNWFINARVRLWKPMVEEMYLEEIKEQETNNNPDYSLEGHAATDQIDENDNDENGNNIIASGSSSSSRQQQRLLMRSNNEDQKPTPDQLVRIDSECLSSIINNSSSNIPAAAEKIISHDHGDKNNGKSIIHQESAGQAYGFSRGAAADSLGAAMEFDFSSYNGHHHQHHNSSPTSDHQVHFGNGNAGISLTLGLQQHGGSGVSLAFSPSAASHHHHHQNSTALFYSRDHIEDCQPVHQYSLLDSEGQNLPYRNLMGAQLLHDLAG